MGDSIVRKTSARLNKDDASVVCLPGTRIRHVAERVERILGHGMEGPKQARVG